MGILLNEFHEFRQERWGKPYLFPENLLQFLQQSGGNKQLVGEEDFS